MDRLLKKFLHYLELQEKPCLKNIVKDLNLKEHELVELINILKQKGIDYIYINLFKGKKKQ